MGTPDVAYISRSAGPLILDGLLAPTLASLVQGCGGDDKTSDFVVADLSLGAWRSHAAAAEFFAQLGLDWPWPAPAAPLAPLASSLPPYAETIGDGIDAETRGDRAALDALELATRIVQATRDGISRVFVVLVPRFGFSWEPEDLWLVRFLAQGLNPGPCRLILADAGPEAPNVPGDWAVHWRPAQDSAPPPACGGLLSLVPGVIDPEVCAAIAGLEPGELPGHLSLACGQILIAPETRRSPQEVSRLEYDRLAAGAHRFEWLEAYAQSFGNNFFVDPSFLAAVAWRRFAEGGHGLALRLFHRAVSCARTPVQQATCQSSAQGIRIATQQFEDAAGIPDPSPAISPPLRGFLLQTKGWALAMLDQAASADAYLREARGLLEPFLPKRERFYLMNIWARSQLRLGNLEAALAIEKEIEAGIAEDGDIDYRLQYINALNTARLYRRLADFDAAARYYRRAFSTTLGVRSESDWVYANFCLASLETERGAHAEAFPCWLRACLHWVSSQVPEALAPRVAAGILRRKLSRTGDCTEEISAALISQLLAAVAAWNGQSGLLTTAQTAADASSPPVFLRAAGLPESTAARTVERAVGAAGWGVLVARSTFPAPFEGPEHRKLRRLLHRLMTSFCPAADLQHVGTFVVDDRLGNEIPTTARELIEVCIRSGVPEMVFGSERIPLHWTHRLQLERASRVQIGSAVARLEREGDGAVVMFKRSLPPRHVPSPERRVLEQIGDEPSVEELAARIPDPDHPGGVVELVRRLERWRVVTVSLPEVAHVQAAMI